MQRRVFIYALCVVLLLDVTESAKKSHGESCHKRKECDSSLGLTCLKNSCQCRPETTYSEKAKSCLIRIGRRCDEASRNDTDSNNDEDSTTIYPATGKVVCIENAECKKLRTRHWCQCVDNFVPNANGTECRNTKSLLRYGEFCDEDSDQCDSSLVCLDGNCQCPFPKDQQFFDQFEGRCTSFAGSNCSVPKMSSCVPNAECTQAQVRMGYTTEKGVKKIHTKTVTQCLCKPGFSQTSNGYCWGAFQTACSSKQPCNSEHFLVCADGKCKCRNPLHEAVDDNGECVNLVGTTCAQNKGPRCVRNAECVDAKCSCIEGYSATPNKTCLLDYKESCQPFGCNNFLGLSCIRGVCECFDSYLLYDTSNKACVGVSSSSDE